jgi:hypothetical protein
MAYSAWRAAFARVWQQGEHIALLGQTGSGKTYTARDLLHIRDYVMVLAVKRHDDVLQQFARASAGAPKYHKLKQWPPDYYVDKGLFVVRPESLADSTQASKVYEVLNGVFKQGSWCLFVDDTGYVTGTLGLKRAITVLLNQGRSSGISVVTAATQVTSVAANIPSETLRQVRHVLMWRFESEADIEACARICGVAKKRLAAALNALYVYSDSSTDFLAYRRGYGLTVVRQER